MLATELGSRPDVLGFEDFRLDVPRAEFSRAGEPIPLRPKAFALLLHLARNAGRVITKTELLARVWSGVVVTDDSLSQCINELRTALGERGPALIRTLPRRGYLFDTDVHVVPSDASAPSSSVAESGGASRPTRASPRWAAAAGALLLVVVAAGIGFEALSSSKPARIDAEVVARRSIAVMPFNDLSSPPTPYLAEGVTQEIVTQLGRLPDALVVVGTAPGAGPTAVDPRAVGRQLDVRYLLTGSVQHRDGQIAVDIQMAGTDNGALLWSERFDYAQENPGILSDISQRVAGLLAIRLEQAANEPARLGTHSNQAIDRWMRGAYLLRHLKAREDLLEARRDLEAAVAADPQSMHALSLLAATYINEVVFRWSADRSHALALAKEYAQRGLAIDPDHGLALSVLGNAYVSDSDFDAARAAFTQALKVNPNSAQAHRDMATLLYYTARFDEVRPEIEMALRLGSIEPSNVGRSHSILGFSLMVTGHDEEAYEELRRAVIAEPSLPGPRYGLIAAAALTGRADEAHRLVAEALRERPEMTVARMWASGASNDTAFRAAHVRYFEGLRRAGLPEGEPPTKVAAVVLDQNRK